jgi:hypothetical protein
MQWDGNEVDAAIDTPLTHLSEKSGSIDGQAIKVQAKNVKVPCMHTARVSRRELNLR